MVILGYCGTVFKLGEHGDGLRLLHMNFVGLEHAFMITSTRHKYCLGKGSLKSTERRFTIWHLLVGNVLWTIWIEHNDKVFNHAQWHESMG